MAGYSTIKSAYKTLIIRNTSGGAVSVSGATIAPGKSKEVAAYVFMQDKFRSNELATLIRRGSINVSLSVGGAAGLALSADDLLGAEAPLQLPWTSVQSAPTASFPAFGDVPVGTLMFDTTTSKLMLSDGSAWVDVTGT